MRNMHARHPQRLRKYDFDIVVLASNDHKSKRKAVAQQLERDSAALQSA